MIVVSDNAALVSVSEADGIYFPIRLEKKWAKPSGKESIC